MSATIKVGGLTATIKDYVWTSEDAGFAEYLNITLDPLGPSGADPAPDYHAALAAAKELHGKVTEYDLPDYVAGRVY